MQCHQAMTVKEVWIALKSSDLDLSLYTLCRTARGEKSPNIEAGTILRSPVPNYVPH